jgi:hypothetical protein
MGAHVNAPAHVVEPSQVKLPAHVGAWRHEVTQVAVLWHVINPTHVARSVAHVAVPIQLGVKAQV